MLSGTIHNIRRSLSTRPTSTAQQSYELEAKFGRYIPGPKAQFNSSIPYVYFERLLNAVKQLPLVTAQTTEISTVNIGDQNNRNIRQVITTVAGDDSSEKVVWQRKTNIEHFEIPEYDIRISANLEEIVDAPVNFVIKTIRERTRYSFTLGDKLMRLDLTEVIMTDDNKIARPTYEAELEFLGTIDDLPAFEREIEVIYKLLRGTRSLYTTTIREQVTADVGAVLGSKDRGVLVEARNLKKRDVVYGGIVGNNHVKESTVLAEPPRTNRRKGGTAYAVTYKADGLRKMLVIHRSGIWLIYPPYEFNLVIDINQANDRLTTIIKVFHGTVLDGELVTPLVSKPTAYYYLAFDCLSSPISNPRSRSADDKFIPSRGVQSKPYFERRKVVEGIAEILKNTSIIVDTKETYELDTPEKFFTVLDMMLVKRDKLDYQEDGLIFLPIDAIYNPLSQRFPLDERRLTQIPDVVKLKEVKDITIDFAIKWIDGNRIELMSYDKISNSMVAFRGSNINPVTPDMIDSTSPILFVNGAPLPSGSIVEYEWTGELFRPRKWRPDKQHSNSLEIALDNWEDIKNPISYEFILGQTLGMAYEYHKRIKRALYESLTMVDGKRRGINILDIGSGRGGDVVRWQRLRQGNETGFVVAVEPNVDNREDLKERLTTLEMNQRVHVVPTGGEDTVAITQTVQQFIPGGKVDAITLMLSLSFFWATSSHLDALVRTIVTNLKPGGTIVFLTIDGDTVEQLFEPAFSPQDHVTDKKIAEAELHLHKKSVPPYGRALDINLPGTIVGQQREYLVHLNDLTTRLAAYGFELEELHRAEGEKLLSENNRLYSSLFSFGVYNNVNAELLNEAQRTLPVTNIILTAPEILEPDVNETMNLPTVPPISPVRTAATIAPVINTVDIPTPTLPVIEPVIVPQVRPAIIKLLVPTTNKPNKLQIDMNQLRWLSVTHITKGGLIIQGPAIGDDTYAPLRATWHNNLVRIATIGDGNCFVHAVLKGFYRKYQDNNDAKYRLDLSSVVRRDLGSMLSVDNPAYPGRSYWMTAAYGAFPRMVMQQITDEELVRDVNLDYSMNGLQRLFNSTVQLGDEVYSYIADVLGVDIYILRATTEDLYPHLHTHRPGRDRPIVVIVGNTYHYELVALDTVNGFQTVFMPGDPFIAILTERFVGDRDLNDIYNMRTFDPDEEFVKNAIDAFGGPDKFQTPDNLLEIFTEEDDFMLNYNRLLPRIQETARLLQIANQEPATVETLPVAQQFDNILRIMSESGIDGERLVALRELFLSRIIPGAPITIDGIVGSLLTDGLITEQEAQTIEVVRASL